MDSSRLSIERFCAQYKQLETAIDYPGSAVLREPQIQDELYSRLFADGALKYQPPPRYRLRVLKELCRKIEASIDDWDLYGVSEDLMSALSELLAQPLPDEATAVQQKCYVTYHLSLLPAIQATNTLPEITILESRSLISASGTTGLRTWEAALHLGQYLCAHPSIVRGRRVLELGTGTGYLAVLCAHNLGASHVLATDGSDDVVNALPENLFLNGLQGSGAIKISELRWGHALVGTEEGEWNGGGAVDLVLGADVTFDGRVIPALIGTLEELTDMFPAVEILISATQRNADTLEMFLAQVSSSGFQATQVAFDITPNARQLGPFYSDQTPILIFVISKPCK